MKRPPQGTGKNNAAGLLAGCAADEPVVKNIRQTPRKCNAFLFDFQGGLVYIYELEIVT
jgi:hypothetical protein